MAGEVSDDPREIEEFRRGTSREAKEEFNKYLRDRNLAVTILNGKVCLIAREDMDGFAKPPSIDPKKCAQPDCSNTYVPHREGAIEAHNRGWFLQKNHKSWCPEHIPDWVEEWRKRNG